MRRLTPSLVFLLPLLGLPLAFAVACSDTNNNSTANSDAGVVLPTTDSGAPTTPDDSGTGPDASASFIPSNFDPSQIDMSLATDVNVNGDNGGCNLDTDNPSTFSCNNQATPFSVAVKQVTQPNGAPTLVVIGVKSFQVGQGVTLTISGSHPLAIYSTGAVSIAGTINASAGGSTEGNGAIHAGGLGEPAGAADDSKLGSAGASFCGKGGSGAPIGDAGAGFGTTPTAAYGSASLSPIYGGSSGGRHSSTGYGGGAVQITSLVSVDIGGEIEANGDGGNEGGDTIGGGGGGSGGAILLEAPIVSGSGKLLANGGGGASVTTAGSDGQESAQAAPGGAPSGGAGAAGATIDGQPGSQVNGGGGSDNGGGGGGAGYIRLNTQSGAATFSGTASPALTTTCGTQGTLKH